MAQHEWFALPPTSRVNATVGLSHHFVSPGRWDEKVVKALRILEQQDPAAFAALADPSLTVQKRFEEAYSNEIDFFWGCRLLLSHGDQPLAKIFITPTNLTEMGGTRSSLILYDCDVPTANEVRFGDVEAIVKGWRGVVDHNKLLKRK